MQIIYYFLILSFSILMLSSCVGRHLTKTIHYKIPENKLILYPQNRDVSMLVTATAYTSRRCETDSTPCIAAWNNRLKPNMKCIAVSRDLLKLGLTNGAKVRISGWKGEFTVLDKMHKRWRKRIDIYMGKNLRKALNWGKRRVVISWHTPIK